LSFLIPNLEPDYVANRIVAAIRQGEEVVIIPWIFNIPLLLKALLPVWLIDKIMYHLGCSNTMDTFVGHKRKQI